MHAYFLRNCSLIWQNMTFNADETFCSTVTNPSKVITRMGWKQIAQVTPAKRGTLWTSLFFINAAGFTRLNYTDVMLTNGPPVPLGLAHISGWINKNYFLKVLEEFVMQACKW